MEVKRSLPGAVLLALLYILLLVLLHPSLPTRTEAASAASSRSQETLLPLLQDEENNLYPDLRVSPPCPNAAEIFPCTCMNYSQGRTYVSCEGITDEKYAYRALHAPGYGANPVASFSMCSGTVKTVSDGLFDEHSFEDVHMYDNEIAILEPGTLEPLKYDLTSLYLNDNQLRHHVVDQVVGFTTLYELHMGNNLIENISTMATIEGIIPKLRVIDFAGNLLTEVPANAFQALPSVLMIILSDNFISYVHPESFIGLEILDYIYLDGNNLNHLGSEEVGKVVVSRQIFRLDLARNEIDSLVPGFVQGLGDASALTLDDNPMKYFPEEVFGDLLRNMSISDYPYNYHGIDVYHNWIECDCDFLWVAIDGWLNAHLFGGHCGNKTGWPWEWTSIDDVDVEALKNECLPLTTFEPPPPNYEEYLL